MFKLNSIVRINDIASDYHGKKCKVIHVGEKSFDIVTIDTNTRIRVVAEQLIGLTHTTISEEDTLS